MNFNLYIVDAIKELRNKIDTGIEIPEQKMFSFDDDNTLFRKQ